MGDFIVCCLFGRAGWLAGGVVGRSVGGWILFLIDCRGILREKFLRDERKSD